MRTRGNRCSPTTRCAPNSLAGDPRIPEAQKPKECGLRSERPFSDSLIAKTHVNRAATKLHTRGRAQLVVLAYEFGLVVGHCPACPELRRGFGPDTCFSHGRFALEERGTAEIGCRYFDQAALFLEVFELLWSHENFRSEQPR